MISEFYTSSQLKKNDQTIVDEDWNQLLRIASTSIVPEQLHFTGSGNMKHSLGLSAVNDFVDLSEIPAVPCETDSIPCSSLPVMEYNDKDSFNPLDMVVLNSSQCDLSSVVIGSAPCIDTSEDVDSPYSGIDLSYLSDLPGADDNTPGMI